MYLISAVMFNQYLISKMDNENCVLYSAKNRFYRCHGCYIYSVSQSKQSDQIWCLTEGALSFCVEIRSFAVLQMTLNLATL